jgi:hypothetical protein
MNPVDRSLLDSFGKGLPVTLRRALSDHAVEFPLNYETKNT